MISVVIPCHNRAHTIARAVRSVLAQTFPDFEVIVVDDQSADDSVQVVEAIGDPRVRVLRNARNLGAGLARNAGAQAARGAYIAFLDSDDWWQPGKLAAQRTALQAAQDPARAFCSHPYFVHDEGARRVWPKRGPRPGEALSDYMFAANGNFQTSTWFWSRALCLQFPFSPELRRHEDWDVLLRLAHAGAEFLFVPEALGHRSCAPTRDRLSEVTDVAFSRAFLADHRELMTPPARAAFGARILSWQLYKCGHRQAALDCVWRGWRERGLSAGESVKIALRLTFPGIHAALVGWKEHPAATGGSR